MRRGEFPDDHDLQCYTTCIMKLLRTVSEKLKRFLSSKIYQVRWINLYNTLDAFFPQFKNGNFDFDMIVKQLEITMPPEEVVIGKEIVAVCRNEGKDNKINSIFTRLDALRSVNFLSFEFLNTLRNCTQNIPAMIVRKRISTCNATTNRTRKSFSSRE